jgi:hypothetical protein
VFPTNQRTVNWLSLVLSLSCFGCVTVYQPLSGLNRPTAIDVNEANFLGTSISLTCEKGEYLGAGDSARLCKHMRLMFERQGARVEVTGNNDNTAGVFQAQKPDLLVTLKSRLLHQETNAIWVILSAISLTLIPSVSEFDFAQELTVRDASGALLKSDSLEGRFIRYAGFGMWALTGFLDFAVRPKDEAQGGKVFQEAFSKDFQRHISQQVFHARMRAVVLHEFEPKSTPVIAAP